VSLANPQRATRCRVRYHDPHREAAENGGLAEKERGVGPQIAEGCLVGAPVTKRLSKHRKPEVRRLVGAASSDGLKQAWKPLMGRTDKRTTAFGRGFLGRSSAFCESSGARMPESSRRTSVDTRWPMLKCTSARGDRVHFESVTASLKPHPSCEYVFVREAGFDMCFPPLVP
jgi:hypothetical protein